MINALVFDLGGVVLTNDDVGILSDNEETKKLLKTTQEKLLEGWGKAWPLARDGKMDEEEFFTIIQKQATGFSKPGINSKLKKIYREKTTTLPTYKLLKGFKEKYNTFALTNITKFWLEYKRDKYNLDKYFDLIVSSCNEGVPKPKAEIFSRLISKTKIDPSTTLFIDDHEKSTTIAEKLGFNVYLFDNKAGLLKNMESLGG